MAINDLGVWGMGMTIVTLIAALFAPNRPQMARRDLITISVAMLVGGFFLSIML